MLKKSVFLAIAFLVIGLTVVQAQTAQQQRELEQIARRSMNGLSAQDRQRVIQIMTDVYVSQGMSRTQAAQFAEMAADSMFSDYQEDAQSAEARRQVEASEQQQRRQLEERNRNLAELEQRQQPGQNDWPSPAQWQERGISNLQQPSGTQASYSGEGNWIERIFLTGANANTLQDLKRQIERIVGRAMAGSGNRFSIQYRGDRSGGSYIDIELSGTEITISFREAAG